MCVLPADAAFLRKSPVPFPLFLREQHLRPPELKPSGTGLFPEGLVSLDYADTQWKTPKKDSNAQISPH